MTITPGAEILASDVLSLVPAPPSTPPGWGVDGAHNVYGTSFLRNIGGAWRTLSPTGANLLDYGADPTGATDCSAGFMAALAASPQLIIPPGTYQFSAELDWTVPAGTGLSIQGAGAENTILRFAAGNNGLSVSLPTVYTALKLGGFTVATQGASGSTAGLSITETGVNGPSIPIIKLEDLSFRGSDGYYVGNYWGEGINTNARAINYMGCNFVGGPTNLGYGLVTYGTSTNTSIVHNLLACNFWGLNVGFQCGTYVQGIVVNTCNFTGINTGVNLPASQSGNDQLAVLASQFYCYLYGIYTGSPCLDVSVVGNTFILPSSSAYGMAFDQYSKTMVLGNGVNGNGGNGVFFNNYNSLASIVTGNSFSGCATGVWLFTPSQRVNVQSNAYSGNTSNTVNSGTNNTIGGGSP